MATIILLGVVAELFGVAVDADTDGGRILAALSPAPPLRPGATTGTAAAAGVGGALTLTLPDEPIDFRPVAPTGGRAGRVELGLT